MHHLKYLLPDCNLERDNSISWSDLWKAQSVHSSAMTGCIVFTRAATCLTFRRNTFAAWFDISFCYIFKMLSWTSSIFMKCLHVSCDSDWTFGATHPHKYCFLTGITKNIKTFNGKWGLRGTVQGREWNVYTFFQEKKSMESWIH